MICWTEEVVEKLGARRGKNSPSLRLRTPQTTALLLPTSFLGFCVCVRKHPGKNASVMADRPETSSSSPMIYGQIAGLRVDTEAVRREGKRNNAACLSAHFRRPSLVSRPACGGWLFSLSWSPRFHYRQSPPPWPPLVVAPGLEKLREGKEERSPR